MSKLNANAQPFVPATTRAATTAATASKLRATAQPFTVANTRVAHYAVKQGRHTTSDKDERSLFMTFSSGSPLTKEEISQYFTRAFGKCVEYVHVHELRKNYPEFGEITFTSTLPGMILLNRKVVKILANNKSIWLKKYVPRSQRKSMAQRSF